MENVLDILNVHSGVSEAQQSWRGPYAETTTALCALAQCAPGTVTTSNDETEVQYRQNDRGPSSPKEEEEETFNFQANPGKADTRCRVSRVVQEAGPSASWDTTDANVTDTGRRLSQRVAAWSVGRRTGLRCGTERV